MDAPRDEDDEHAVASGDGVLDDPGVVGGSGSDRDAVLEPVELGDTLLPADGDHLVAAIERVLHHVSAELPGGSDDADPHRAPCVSVASSAEGMAIAPARSFSPASIRKGGYSLVIRAA